MATTPTVHRAFPDLTTVPAIMAAMESGRLAAPACTCDGGLLGHVIACPVAAAEWLMAPRTLADLEAFAACRLQDEPVSSAADRR